MIIEQNIWKGTVLAGGARCVPSTATGPFLESLSSMKTGLPKIEMSDDYVNEGERMKKRRQKSQFMTIQNVEMWWGLQVRIVRQYTRPYSYIYR